MKHTYQSKNCYVYFEQRAIDYVHTHTPDFHTSVSLSKGFPLTALHESGPQLLSKNPLSVFESEHCSMAEEWMCT